MAEQISADYAAEWSDFDNLGVAFSSLASWLHLSAASTDDESQPCDGSADGPGDEDKPQAPNDEGDKDKKPKKDDNDSKEAPDKDKGKDEKLDNPDAGDETDDKDKPKKHKKFLATTRSRLLLAAGLISLTLIGLAAGQTWRNVTAYDNRPQLPPQSWISGVDVSDLDEAQAQEKVNSSFESMTVDLKLADESKTYKPQEVGASFDIAPAIEKIRSAQKAGSITERLDVDRVKSAEVDIVIDAKKVDKTLADDFDDGRQAKSSEIAFDDNAASFYATESASGLVIDTDSVISQIKDSAENLQPSEITLNQQQSSPKVEQKDLKPEVNKLNSAIATPVTISTAVGNFSPNNYTKKKWLIYEQEDSKVTVSYDENQINSYVESVVADVNRDPQSGRYIDLGSSKMTLSAGAQGYQVKNVEQIKTTIVQSFKSAQPAVVEADVEVLEAPSEKVEGSEGRWIYSDLSEFRTYAYEGDKVVRTFAMSPGVDRFKTVTGTFNVWAKVRKQTMTGGSEEEGDYYSVPNVEWIAYFHQGYALHGVHWHNNFGISAESHGCIGMSNTDAQWVYNFVEVGTPVVVVP